MTGLGRDLRFGLPGSVTVFSASLTFKRFLSGSAMGRDCEFEQKRSSHW